jgi:phosphoglycolate phosphatase
MKRNTPPQNIQFDWHATWVDTFNILCHDVDALLEKMKQLGLYGMLTPPGKSKNIEDAKQVEFVHTDLATTGIEASGSCN